VISPDTIFSVNQTAKIEDVVSRYVKLKRQGANLIGLCPFHDEKTPSFSVSPVKNIFKCFGCGKGGNALYFLTESQHMEFPKAVRFLADMYSIPIDEREPTPEEKTIIETFAKVTDIYSLAANYYHQNLLQNPDVLAYVSNRISSESINLWQIGFAPETSLNFFSHASAQGHDVSLLLESNLVRQSERDNSLFDFFRGRIIFPIFDQAGRIISFAGRILPQLQTDKTAKYINLPDSELYHKKEVFYGINFAIREIRKSRKVNTVEGNFDVIKMHELGFVNTLACSGTAFTIEHATALKKHADKIVFINDGDPAGEKATIKAGKLATEKGMFAYLVNLPENTDPADAFQNPEEAAEYLKKNEKDFIGYRAEQLLKAAGTDPMLKNDAINEIGDLLFPLPTSTRELYITNISRSTKLKAKLLTDRLKELELYEKRSTPAESSDFSLPPGVNANDIEIYGFYEYENEYHFRSNSAKGYDRLSNFTMRPIFHVNSIYESKRIYELVNNFGYKVVVDLDMQEMTSLQAFNRNIEGRGNFLFWGQLPHFNKLKLRLYEETLSANEIRYLGWQKEGFWAWSNGIITEESGFKEIDEYGVIKHDDINYFIPAFSRIYIHDKSIFLDERKFKFTQRDITLTDWANLFQTVYGDNGRIGIAFWIATVFRDVIIRKTKNFPLLNLFGPKGTGKSEMAISMLYLFGAKQNALNIHNNTKAAMSEHLQQFCNALAWIDEYKNDIDREKVENLKAIFDGVGRTRMSMDKGKKKESTAVTAGVIISGQEMPTADIAFYSRLIFLQFTKDKYTPAETTSYEELQAMQDGGLSHLTSQLLGIRKHFETHFEETYQSVHEDFNNYFTGNDTEDRIKRSYVTMVAATRTAEMKIKFPYTSYQLFDIAIKAIEFQTSQISKSNEIGIFWNTLEALFDENEIQDKWHFRIDYCETIKTHKSTIEFSTPRHVLKFKYNAIYSVYSKHLRRQGLNPMSSDSLAYYLKIHKSFIGIQEQCVFNSERYNNHKNMMESVSQNTSAMCFTYDPNALQINLTRSNDTDNPYNRQTTINSEQ